MIDFNFYSFEDTLLKIKEEVTINKKSFVRFGDGEIRILCNHCGPDFQKLDPNLRKNLFLIIKSKHPNLVLCLANYHDRKPWYNKFLINNISSKEIICETQFTRMLGPSKLKVLWEKRKICYVGSFTDNNNEYQTIINNIIACCQESKIPLNLNKNKSKRKIDQEYVSQEITKDNSINKLLDSIAAQINTEELLDYSVNNSVSLIKEIMTVSNYSFYTTSFLNYYFRKNKDLLCSISNIKKKNDLDKIFSNGQSTEYILTNYKNSFQQFEEIKKECLKKEKDILFIISSGPMGKVLNYNLTTHGFQCLDIGHL